jgi:hypothetical protein
VTAEKRQGPRMLPIVYKCAGCAFYSHEFERMPFCNHARLHNTLTSFHTPSTCPLMPVRKVIGTCAECAHAVITDRDGLLMCKRVRTLKRGHMFVVRPDFGCIHWEQKP